MAGYGPPILDFSSIGNLPNDFAAARNQRNAWRDETALKQTLAQLPVTADGQIDYSAAAQNLLRIGAVEPGMGLARTGQAISQDQRDFAFRQEQAAYQREQDALANRRADAQLGMQRDRMAQANQPPPSMQQQYEELAAQLQSIGIDPNSPRGQAAIAKRLNLPAPNEGDSAAPDYNEQQAKSLIYYQRGIEANDVLNQYEAALADGTQRLRSNAPVIGNRIVSAEFQQAEQAAREVLAAILRKDTGAAITNWEMEQYGKTYIPQWGDSPQTIEQKRLARERALEGIRASMGDVAPAPRESAPQAQGGWGMRRMDDQ